MPAIFALYFLIRAAVVLRLGAMYASLQSEVCVVLKTERSRQSFIRILHYACSLLRQGRAGQQFSVTLTKLWGGQVQRFLEALLLLFPFLCRPVVCLCVLSRFWSTPRSVLCIYVFVHPRF
jgi:hypothetical protein